MSAIAPESPVSEPLTPGAAGPRVPSASGEPARPEPAVPGGAAAPTRRSWIGPRGVLIALPWIVLAVALAAALAPGLFTGHDPIAGSSAEALQAPSAAHWFGTDATGRDVFSRVVYGAVHSLSAALVAVSVGFVVGTAIGLVAGAIGGRLDSVLMRGIDVLLAIPGLLLSLSIIILLGFGPTQAAIAVGATSVASFARLMRSEVVRVRSADYVEAAYASGGRTITVLVRHVLPNSITSVISLAVLNVGTAILAIATLGFLGYGAPPPTPEWGLMIAEGRDYVATAWWLTTLPGLVVVAVVLAANRLGNGLGSRA